MDFSPQPDLETKCFTEKTVCPGLQAPLPPHTFKAVLGWSAFHSLVSSLIVVCNYRSNACFCR